MSGEVNYLHIKVRNTSSTRLNQASAVKRKWEVDEQNSMYGSIFAKNRMFYI